MFNPLILSFLTMLVVSTQLFAAYLDDEYVPIHQVSADECRLCHMEIYEQWKGSMHAQSTALNDPIHAAFYKKVVGDPLKEGVKTKSGKYPVCLKCHAPNAAEDGKTKLDTMASYSEGVSCVACHRFKDFKGTRLPDGKLRLGIDAYTRSDDLQGPSGFLTELFPLAVEPDPDAEEGKFNPHKQRPSVATEDDDEVEPMPFIIESSPRVLKTSAACLGCHDKRKNSHGVALCGTGDEYLAGKTQVACQSCHMPIANGFANHSMGGGHDIATLRRAVVMDISAKSAGDNVAVEVLLHNQQPHNTPTGAPFRNMSLRVSAYDEEGKELWANYQKHPATEDPKAWLYFRLEDADGNFTVPPKAIKAGTNSALKPYEKRNFSYTVPKQAAAVKLVRAELFYNLLWPKLNKKMKHLPEELRASKRIGFIEVELDAQQQAMR